MPPDAEPHLAAISDVVRPILPYGIGIDTHKGFIQVCVLAQFNGEVQRVEAEFETSWPKLVASRDWAIAELKLRGHLPLFDTLRYTIESTGCYHMPVMQAWQGIPSVVNPLLAGPTRRKTDVLDARMLAHHSLVGLWRSSFIPTVDAEILRVLVAMRNEATRFSTRCLNRINNHMLRFGHTLGRECSMADNRARAVVEDMLLGKVQLIESVRPDGIPEDARCIFKDSYKFYDQFKDIRETYHTKALNFVKRRQWPIQNGSIPGGKLLKILQTVPGVGEVSALTWLSVVCDPRRFEAPGQVAAFCGADPSLKVSAGKVTSHIKRKGNARLHHVLKNVSAQLVRRHRDAIGQWGFALMRRHAKGGWARAINAVSRRLAIFLWHVHRTGFEFSFEQYQFMVPQAVQDMPIEETDLHTRYKSMLAEAGLTRTGEVALAFLTTLPQQKGLGAGCLKAVKQWMDSHPAEAKTTSPSSSSVSPMVNVSALQAIQVDKSERQASREDYSSQASSLTAVGNGSKSGKPKKSVKKSRTKST